MAQSPAMHVPENTGRRVFSFRDDPRRAALYNCFEGLCGHRAATHSHRKATRSSSFLPCDLARQETRLSTKLSAVSAAGKFVW